MKEAKNIKDIEILLKLGESQKVEYKEGISTSFAREMVAFANAEGGKIFIGVSDSGKLIGFETTNRLSAIVQDIARNCDPAVKIILSKVNIEHKDLLVIDVPEGEKKPYSCSEGYFLRVGSTSQKLKRDELIDFIRKVRPYCFDELPCHEFRYPQDLDKKALAVFLDKSGIRQGRIATVDLLKNLGVVAEARGDKIILNNAGALFFAKEPKRFIRQSEVTCVLFQGTSKADILDRKDMQGTLFENVEQAMVFLKRHLSLRYEIKTLKRKEILELPEEALREAVLNAVTHRDYSIAGAHVMVEIFRDRVEIVDPGGLPPGLKRSELGKRSVHRNPRLADLFHRMGEIEKVGSGIHRMKEAAKEAHVAPPRFEVSGFFVISFRRMVERSVPSPSQVRPKSVPCDIANAILVMAKQPATIGALMSSGGYTNRTRFREQVLRPLIEAGLLRMTDPDKPQSSKQRYVALKK